VAELKELSAQGDILKSSTNGSQTVFASGIGQPRGNGGPEFLEFRGGPGTAINKGLYQPWLISLIHDPPNSFALTGYPVHLADSQSARFSLGHSLNRQQTGR
jgi:hypothetical protein